MIHNPKKGRTKTLEFDLDTQNTQANLETLKP